MMKTNKFTLLISILFTSLSLYSSQVKLAIENDALMSAGDNDYTHGTYFEYITDSRWHINVGQNMYSPSDLTKKDHIKGDRPYAGFLYKGLGKEVFFEEGSPWSHYVELDAGIIGKAARCKETQKLIHKWLNCRDPKGWDNNQLHDEIIINTQWWTKYNWYVTDWFAIVPRAGLLAGNLQDCGELGVDFKIGYNLHNDVGNTILLSNPQKDRSWTDKLSWYIFAGVDERYYVYNHFLQGSMFNNKDDDIKVGLERFVPEARCGLYIQYGQFYIQYYAIFRGNEFKGQKHKPNYGGLCIGFMF